MVDADAAEAAAAPPPVPPQSMESTVESVRRGSIVRPTVGGGAGRE